MLKGAAHAFSVIASIDVTLRTKVCSMEYATFVAPFLWFVPLTLAYFGDNG